MRKMLISWRDHLLPWSGLLAGFLGWALTDQFGSNFSFDMCQGADPVLMGLVGLAGLAVALAGGFLSWRLWRRDGETETRRFLALIGALASLLFSISIVFQTVSSFIIPRCLA